MTAAILALVLAHEAGVSSSRLELRGGEVRATFTFSLEDLAGLARLDLDRSGTVDADEWSRAMPAIFGYLGDHFRIEGCRSEADPSVVPPPAPLHDPRRPVTLALRYIASGPLDRVLVRCDLFREHGGNPRHIAEFPGGGTVVFDTDRREAERPVGRPGFPLWGIAAGALIATATVGSWRRLARGAERSCVLHPRTSSL